MPRWEERLFLKRLTGNFFLMVAILSLSPMYHAILTEDLLDLINLCINTGPSNSEQNLPILQKRASNAMGWLGALIDRKGFFPLLNDAAYGIAPILRGASGLCPAIGSACAAGRGRNG